MKSHPVIDPHAVYTIQSARAELGLAKATLPREIRLGRLRVAKRAGKYFVLGTWLLEWLAGGEIRRGGHAGGPLAEPVNRDGP